MVGDDSADVSPTGTAQATWTEIYANILAAAIPATVVLFPVLMIGLLAERDVFAAIVWRGNVTALSLGLVPLLLPLLAFSVTFLVLHRLRGWGSQRAWRASCWSLLLLPAVPTTLGFAQAGLILAGVSAANRVRRAASVALSLALFFGGLTLGVLSWSDRGASKPW
ncbi:hypothetical protein [Paractinoplanes atraurantiacus]|uniref:Uncharacterized protein n=1 Tax=Paractinoplanes atraurantiacus TaxID=1036182 RepID=A0A285IKT4_9ACTN|nr:hypothetical protein [Actinoplanes atraurantiacus]SNY48564.1 hypothetical protein SAMN05421748_10931 [Actinoplanes atraurantiacus]